jgi:dienelactone hydrolase
MGSRVDLHRSRVAALVAAAGFLVAAAGCTPTRHAAVTVSPVDSRADEPVSITVTGLPKGATTQIGVSSTDAGGEQWSSQATFTADAGGTVRAATAASTGGSYLGVSPTGLITSMRTGDATSKANLTYRAPATGPSTFQVAVHADGVDQAATFTRTFIPDPLDVRTLSLQRDHVYGTYMAPVDTSTKQPAVVLLGGSNGGVASLPLAQAFAARGVPALAIAYFGAPGLPKTLADVPLEYFRTAVTWLARQPGVDPQRIWVAGGSYGSEAALLTGARYPDLVHGVVSLSGGNTVTCSATPGRPIDVCQQAPFTSGGEAVAYTRQFNNPDPTDEPSAVIPVEKIKGPVVAVCGGADNEWNACRLSQAALERRKQQETGKNDLFLVYPDAGHFVNFLIPWRPINTSAESKDAGSTPQSDPDADADAWPKVLAEIISS